jgi:uncharacterized protein
VDWTLYWFMFPACIVIATVAMFSGISGAALLTPVFLIGFPLVGLPRLSAVEAIGTSLFLETSGFGAGLYRYSRLRLVDVTTAKSIIAFTLPLGALGAIVARHAPAQFLRLGYGVLMIGLAWFLLSGPHGARADEPAPAVVGESNRSHPPCERGASRDIQAASGQHCRFCAHHLRVQTLLSGAGAFLTGLISTGVGKSTLPTLVRRSRFPVPVAAATSTVIVAGTVAGAATTHLVQLVAAGGFRAVPWNLLVWAMPGAVVGAYIGTHLQGRVSERAARIFFAVLFAAIGIAFLLAFTVLIHIFG